MKLRDELKKEVPFLDVITDAEITKMNNMGWMFVSERAPERSAHYFAGTLNKGPLNADGTPNFIVVSARNGDKEVTNFSADTYAARLFRDNRQKAQRELFQTETLTTEPA